jgi:CheY-like chemotaxis protein
MHPRVVVAVVDDALRHEALTYCRFLASTNAIEASDSEATERATGAPFDLLILDAELPGFAPEALLERLAAEGGNGPRVMLVTTGPNAMTRYPSIIETLSKPVRIESLVLALDRWRESRLMRPSRDRPVPTQSSARQR